MDTDPRSNPNYLPHHASLVQGQRSFGPSTQLPHKQQVLDPAATNTPQFSLGSQGHLKTPLVHSEAAHPASLGGLAYPPARSIYVKVNFVVNCDATQLGQKVGIVGNTEALGDWNPQNAVLMETGPQSFPNWQATVTLPREVIIEYKYVVIQFAKTKDPSGPIPQFAPEPVTVVWESFGQSRANRRLNTFGKKEVYLYEELNSTKVIEEFVEDKTPSPEYARDLVPNPELGGGMGESRSRLRSVGSYTLPNPAGSVGGNSGNDFPFGGGSMHQIAAPLKQPSSPKQQELPPSQPISKKNSEAQLCHQSSNELPAEAPVNSNFKFKREEVLEELEEESENLSTHRKKTSDEVAALQAQLSKEAVPLKQIEDDILRVQTAPFDKQEPVIIAAFLLPYSVEKCKKTGKLEIQKCFHNPTFLYGTMENMGRMKQYNFHWVGLITTVDPLSEDEKAQVTKQFKELNSYPVFFSVEELTPYLGFYENIVRPLFHNFQDLYDMRNDHLAQWKDYIHVNKRIAQKILEIRKEVGAKTIWIHNCHLLMVPQFVKKQFEQANVGMYFHQPFPSSSHFKLNKFKYEILKSLIHCDLIGFHLFMYARNFFKTCQRVLGMDLEFLKGGYLCINFQGKNVMIRVSHMGVEEEFLKDLCHSKLFRQYEKLFKSAMKPVVQSLLKASDPEQGQLKNKVLIMSSIDAYHSVSGMKQKLLSYRQFLRDYPIYQKRMVFVQFMGSIVQAFDKREEHKANINGHIRKEILSIRDEIHKEFGTHCLKLDESNPSLEKRLALWSQTDILLCGSLKEGLCIQVLEYAVCRKLMKKMKDSVMVTSEFAGCNEAMRGVIRYNPFSNIGLIEALDQALSLTPEDKESRMLMAYDHINKNSMTKWIDGFLTDLKHSFNPIQTSYYLGINFSAKGKRKVVNRLMQVQQSFKKLNLEHCAAGLLKANKCVIIIEIESLPDLKFSRHSIPTQEVIETIQGLLIDKRNTVILFGKQSKNTLLEWFGRNHSFTGNDFWIAAESGYLYRPGSKQGWQKLTELGDTSWIGQIRKIMEAYASNIDGAFVEERQSCISFNYKNADQEHGTMFIHDLYNLISKTLKGTPNEIIYGNGFLDVKPQGIRKEKLVEILLEKLSQSSKIDFLFYLGNNSSDEPVYEMLKGRSQQFLHSYCQKFICVLEKKPSEADYYLEDLDSVRSLLDKFYTNTKKRKKIRSFADLTKITNGLDDSKKKGIMNASSIANLNQFMQSKITFEDKLTQIKPLGTNLCFAPKENADNLSAHNSRGIEEESLQEHNEPISKNKYPSVEDAPRQGELIETPQQKQTQQKQTELSAMVASLSGSNVEQQGENNELQYSISNNANMLFGSSKMGAMDFSVQSDPNQPKSLMMNSGDENQMLKDHSPNMLANSPLNLAKLQHVKQQPKSAIGLVHMGQQQYDMRDAQKMSLEKTRAQVGGVQHLNSFAGYSGDIASFISLKEGAGSHMNDGIKKISSMKIKPDNTSLRHPEEIQHVDELFQSHQLTAGLKAMGSQVPAVQLPGGQSQGSSEPPQKFHLDLDLVKSQKNIPPAQVMQQLTKKNLAEKVLKENEKEFKMNKQQTSFCADDIDVDVDNLSK